MDNKNNKNKNKFTFETLEIVTLVVALLCCVLILIPIGIKYNELFKENESLKSQLEASYNETEYYQNLYSELLNGIDNNEYDNTNNNSDYDEFVLRHILYLYDKLGYDYETDYYSGNLQED